MSSKNNTPVDLSGFLDGFQARNMAAIERHTSLQLSELQTRLHLLRLALRDDPNCVAAATLVDEADSALRDASRTIVARLVQMGDILRKLIIEHGSELVQAPKPREQLRWIVQRYIEAAEISHHERVSEAAVALGQAFQSATSAAVA